MRDRHRRFRLSSLFVLLAVPFLLLSCQSAPPARLAPPTEPAPAAAAPAAPAPARKVILLSLDGASADMLHELHKEGALTAGGFETFFRDGQVADRLVPVNPTITAVNHISLATGYPAAQTGIVGNRFHPAGAPFLDSVSGFAAPIASETLWEAVARQGKRAAVLSWPGADAKSLRRTADWGMVWLGEPLRESAVVTLKREDWSRMPPSQGVSDIKSSSPIQHSLAVIGKEGQAGREFELLAVDRTDDGKVNYDALVPVTPGNRAYIEPGKWGRVTCQDPRPDRLIRNTSCWIKVLSLDPELGSAVIYFNATYAIQAYPMTFESALAEADVLWPGAPDDHFLEEAWDGRPGIDTATWTEQAERFAAFSASALKVATGRGDWDLLMSYISVIDEAGHRFYLTEESQPGYSAERRDAFAAARRRVWQAVDGALAALLKTVDLKTTAVVVVSDHGMAPVRTELDPNVLLRDKGVLAADANGKITAAGTRAWAISNGGMAAVYVDPAAPDRERLIADLKSYLAGWTEDGKKPIAKVITRREGAGMGLDNPNSGDLILFAVDGVGFSSNGLRSGHALAPTRVYGMHGYPNTDPRMAGIYMAVGAGVQPGVGGTVRSTEVAGRVAQWLGIEKPRAKVE
jgi:predicted AlkP superfamily pyrophosphatase or phosphodiesterase